MQRLEVFLVRLQAYVQTKKNSAAATLFSGQKQDLGDLLTGIREHAAKVYDVFDRYERGILSKKYDLQFKFKFATQLWFSMVDSSPEKIQALMDDIEYDRSILSDYLTLMNVEGVEEILNKVSKPTNDKKKEKGKEQANAKDKKNDTRVSPSPSPAPIRRDYKILFVDPENTGRSVVAEALVLLLQGLTARANGDWRIKEVHSAGFFVRKHGDCADIIDKLDYSFKSFKKPIMDGGQTPTYAAVSSVFDNKLFEYPFKKNVKDHIAARRSRGLTKDMFTKYDYIIVFTNREHDNVIKLKEALVRAYGRSATARGKGRVLHLGGFLTLDGMPREITTPDKALDGTQSRDNWNWKTSQIKTAIKQFLKSEMKWNMPSQKALQNSTLLPSP
jgi:protein-tyrosine-phosphatase